MNRLLLCSLFLSLAACGGNAVSLSSPSSRSAVVLCDVTSSSCTPPALSSLLSSLVSADASRSVLLYRLDARLGSVVVASFTPTPPTSEARKVVALHRSQMLAESSRLFGAVIPTLFTQPPVASPIAAGILTATATRQGPLELYVLSDGREVSGPMNFERQRLPTINDWHERLVRIGYTDQSLQGVRVHFVGMPLITDTDTAADPARGLATQQLWMDLSSFGADSVSFDPPPSGAFLLFIGPFGYYWRRLRAWLAGLLDGRDKHYAPALLVEALLGPQPLDEYDDPRTTEARHTIEEQRTIIAALKAEIVELTRQLALLPNIHGVITLLILAFLGDLGGSHTLLLDLGMPIPDRYIMAVTFVLFLFVCAGLAAKAAKTTGTKPTWWYVLIIGLTILSLSIMIVRVTSAASVGDPLFAEIAKGIILLAATIGPAILAETLLEKLRVTMPVVRLHHTLQSRLRKAQVAHDKALDYLTKEAKHRKWWQWESTVLRAIYERSYRRHAGPPPPPHDHVVMVEPPVNKPNGLPQWPA